MTKKASCTTCVWLVIQKQSDKSKNIPIGRCKCHVPVMGEYPIIFETDYCSDYKFNNRGT